MDAQANAVYRAKATGHHTVDPRAVSACPKTVPSNETKGLPELTNDEYCYFRNSVFCISLCLNAAIIISALLSLIKHYFVIEIDV